MRNKEEFIERIKAQPKKNWIRNSYGNYSADYHCKLGWVMWTTVFRHLYPEEKRFEFAGAELYIMRHYALTGYQIGDIIDLNDKSVDAEEATEEIIAYVEAIDA